MAEIREILRPDLIDAADPEELRDAATDLLKDTELIGKGGVDVLTERRRQIIEEGWTAEHDDQHHNKELAIAGACYALGPSHVWLRVRTRAEQIGWPWSPEWWKPKNHRRDLVRAAALMIAEIERLDRLPMLDLKARRCRVCGCTDDDCRQCIAKTGQPCHWVEPDLCSACAEETPA
jgi:hypothetical protein